MSDKMYNEIKPFNEFWLDCYSTAIYSILQSNYEVDKSVFYNNNYVYEHSENVRTGMGRAYITINLDSIMDKLFMSCETHDFTKEEDVVAKLKFYIDRKNIVSLGIDMFYGVPDTSQWRKHHINHNILVEGYDDSKQCVYVLETGENGYKEYLMSYDEITKAAKEFICFARDTEIFEVNHDNVFFMVDKKDVINNAQIIVESIDYLVSKVDSIWKVEPEKLLSMKDEIDSHIKSIRNRQEVNAKLFKELDKNGEYEKYITAFEGLRQKYHELLIDIDKICISGEYYLRETQVKNTFKNYLNVEKNLWVEFMNEK